MHIADQVRPQHVLAQRQIVAVLVADTLTPPTVHRRQPTRFASTRVLPSRGVDIGARGKQSSEEVDLHLRGRSPVNRTGVRFEEAGLHRAGRSRLFRCQLQQPQQPRVLRTQLRYQSTEFREFLGEPRRLRCLEIVFHGTHRRANGQMPARSKRSMRLGFRACACRSARARDVNASS